MNATEVNLPAGISADGQWCRTAMLQSLNGYDEEFLLGEGKILSAAARVTHLLTRCLRRLGPLEPVDAASVRRLTVGDREALLLHLRRLAFGDRISCLLACPNCEKKMELDMQISELLLAPYPHASPTYETLIDGEGQAYRVLFRLPNGEDQEVVAVQAAGSVESASEALLRRCIERVASADGEPSVASRIGFMMAPFGGCSERTTSIHWRGLCRIGAGAGALRVVSRSATATQRRPRCPRARAGYGCVRARSARRTGTVGGRRRPS